MKFNYIIVTSFLLTILTSCSDIKKSNRSFKEGNSNPKTRDTIPINYDFDNLKLHLNTSIKDTSTKVYWSWDYMNSNNGGPDSNGVDYYMNHEQPVFTFNNDRTLPTLSVKTNKNQIIEFSVTTIFGLDDTTSISTEKVLNNLNKYDLLKSKDIKTTLIKSHYYKLTTNDYCEELIFEFSDTQNGYSRLTYKIKNNEHTTPYMK